MNREWNNSQPIYRQLRDRGVHMILDGVLKEGDPLPSVRSVAAGARDLLLKAERQKFLKEEWPRIAATIQRLGIKPNELRSAAKNDTLKRKSKP
jgi:GntR family transcriptional regulator